MFTRLRLILCVSIFSLVIAVLSIGCETATVTTTLTTADTTTIPPPAQSTTTTTSPAFSTTTTETENSSETTVVTPTGIIGGDKYDIKIADEAFISQLGKKADEMRKNISSSASSYEESGKTYYVSNDGDDRNNGMSPRGAWATIAKVNSSPIPDGSNVLFKRGGLWREQIIAKNGVTYSAYGEGDKPQIWGSERNYSIKENWLQTEYPNIYVYANTFDNDVGIIIFNHGEAVGIRKIRLVDYFLRIDELSKDLNFYYNLDDRKVYLYSAMGNPADRFSSIEIGDKRHGIVVGAQNDVTIDNLCLKYWGAHGISAGGNRIKNLTVRHCEFGWIGGTILRDIARFGNAVEIWGGCDGYTVENCYIYQVYDAGITHQWKGGDTATPAIKMLNVLYKDNLIEYCTYSIEYFLEQNENPDQGMENILITGNLCRFSGYGWGDQRPQQNTACHINGWDHKNPAINFIIENNIFDGAKYMLVHIGAASADDLPVMRNNTYINELGSNLGKYGQRPTIDYMYDKNVGKTIKDILKDESAEIYYLVTSP